MQKPQTIQVPVELFDKMTALIMELPGKTSFGLLKEIEAHIATVKQSMGDASPKLEVVSEQ